MSVPSLTRRTALAVLGAGLVTALAAACGSTPSTPTVTSAVAPSPVPVPTTATTPAARPTLAPTPVAPAAAPVAPRKPSKIQIAIPNTPFAIVSGNALVNAVNKTPSEQLSSLEVLQVRMDKSGLGPQTAADYGSLYAAQLAAAGSESDLILLENVSLRTVAKMGLLRDLGPMLQKQSWFVAGDYRGNILHTGRVAGKQVGLPLDASVELLVYNRDRLKQLGVPEPPLDWGWEQLAAAAQKLSGDGSWGFRVSDWSPSIFTLAWQSGSEVIDAKGKLQVTEPGMIRALEFLDNLVHTRQVSGPLEAMDLARGSDNPFNLRLSAYDYDQLEPYMASLDKGQTAMLAGQSKVKGLGVGWWDTVFASESSSHLGATVMPHGDHPAVLGAVWTIIGIPSKVADPERSLTALRALRVAAPATLVPALRTPAPNLRLIEGHLTERDAQVLSTSLDVARFIPGDVDLTILELVASQMVLPVVTGKKKPQDAANDAQKAIDKAMG
jgi:maltose-binding protein MalE